MAFTPTTTDTLAAIHHVVHDYADLVSSGTIVTTGLHNGKGLEAPMNTHAETAYLTNSRKFKVFFTTAIGDRYKDDVLAADFVKPGISFTLVECDKWYRHMNQQLLHISHARNANINATPWDGSANKVTLPELMVAWKHMRANPSCSKTNQARTRTAADFDEGGLSFGSVGASKRGRTALQRCTKSPSALKRPGRSASALRRAAFGTEPDRSQ